MGNISVVGFTSDNKHIVLTECSGNQKVPCKYTSYDLKNLMDSAYNLINATVQDKGSNGTLTQIVTGPSYYTYVYDQDHFKGNKYLILPSNNFIVPACFNIQSIATYPHVVKDHNITSDIVNMKEHFDPNSSEEKNFQCPNTIVIILVIIIILLLIQKFTYKQ
jgi:hypothetical protein